MTVYGPATLSAGLTAVRTKMVRCRGARKVAWILRAASSEELAACAAYGTMDPTANADEGNFLELTPGTLGVQAGTSPILGDMSLGGLLYEIGPALGGALCLEQVELKFDAPPADSISGFSIECEIHDEVGADDVNSLAISN